MSSSNPFNLKPVDRVFDAEDVRIMLIEMVTRLVKLQIVALSTPGNPNRTPKVAGIAAKLYSREIAFAFTEKSARLLFVENILVR